MDSRVTSESDPLMTHRKKHSDQGQRTRLEIVLKADSAGSLEAAKDAFEKLRNSDFDVSVIHSGIGDVTRSDLLMAETGSRLIAAFQVEIHRQVETELREHPVEVRLFNVI